MQQRKTFSDEFEREAVKRARHVARDCWGEVAVSAMGRIKSRNCLSLSDRPARSSADQFVGHTAAELYVAPVRPEG